MSPSDLGVFVLATRGAAAEEAGGSGAVKGNTSAAVEQTVCTGVRNRVSLCPIPQWAALEGLHGSGADGRARRRRAGKLAVCACLWRADACAQGVPVARTACVRYASSSGRGQSKEQRA